MCPFPITLFSGCSHKASAGGLIRDHDSVGVNISRTESDSAELWGLVRGSVYPKKDKSPILM